MAILSLQADGTFTSSGTAALHLGLALAADGAFTSTGTAEIGLITAGLVTAAGLQGDVIADTARITAAGLQGDVIADNARLTTAGLGVEGTALVPVQVTAAGLGVDAGFAGGLGARVTATGLQVEADTVRPYTGAALEFHILDRAGNHLAYLDQAYDKSFLAQLNDVGSGQFRIHADDPKATAGNIKARNKILVRYRNRDIATWIIEKIADEVVPEGERAGLVLAVSGRGRLASLEWGQVYPLSLLAPDAERLFVAQTRAAIFLTLYDEFVARGGGELNPDFSATRDSDLLAWTDSHDLNYKPGMTLLDVLKQLVALGGDVTVEADGTLHYWISEGTDRSATVRFIEGRDVLSSSRNISATDQGNAVLATGDGIAVIAEDGANIAAWGRIELHLPISNTPDPALVASASNLMLAQGAAPATAITLEVTDVIHEPFISYGLGDTVWADLPTRGIAAAYRVLHIALSDSGERDVRVTLGLNALDLELLIKMDKAMRATRGGVRAGGASASGMAASAPVGGGPGGISDLDDLDDVIITAPIANDEVLAYDTASGKWINQTAAEAGLSIVGHTHAAPSLDLDDLGDVVITAPLADDEVLAYDTASGKWINQTAVEAGLSAAAHDHDADYVELTGDIMSGDLTVQTEGASNRLRSDVISNTSTNTPFFEGRRAGGTIAAKTKVLTGTPLFAVMGFGYFEGGTPGYSSVGKVGVVGYAAEDWNTSAGLGTYLDLETTKKGTSGRTAKVRVKDDGPLRLIPLTAVPVDSEDGDLAYATGAWNPGQGEGAYEYRDGAWHKVITPGQTIFTVEGTLTAAAGSLRIYNKSGATKTSTRVFLSVATAPTGQAIIVDVHKDGVTIFTNQANRPQIAAAANTGETTTIDVPAWADGSYLTVDVDQIGSGVAGAYLTVHIVFQD